MNVKRCRSRRTGLSMAELVVSMTVAIMALVSIAQLMAMTAIRARLLERDALAVREAGNIMEDMMSCPWGGIDPNKPPQVQLSEACQEMLPEAQLSIEVANDQTLAGVRRITIEIDWVTAAKQRREPVRLVAWRTQDQEEARP